LKFGAPEEIRTPDPQIRSLVPGLDFIGVGQRSITADTAIRLGHWFGTSAEFWLNLQKIYELRVAQKEIGAVVAKLPRLQDRKSSEGRTSV
jgi:plasmid maintenance system antidote protein VapI